MEFKLRELPKSKIEIEVEIPTQEWDEFLNEAIKDLSKNLKIEGFRPGHIPRNIIEREVGTGKILERAADLAVNKTYLNIINKENIEVLGRPQITIQKIAFENPLVYKAEVVVMPKVELPDYEAIAKSEPKKLKNEIKVKEKEIEQAVNWLSKSRAKYTNVEREARKGDRLEIDFSAYGGQNSESPQKIDEAKNYLFIFGEGKFIPGFEKQIENMKVGEEKEFNLVFPTDYPKKELVGSPVNFKVKIKNIQKVEIPEQNDEFAKSLGNFENLIALKQNIKEGILLEKERKEKEAWRIKTIKEIAKKSKIDIPDILVESEIEKMLEELKESVLNMGLEFDKYLEQIKKTRDELRKDLVKLAEERICVALVLNQITKERNIEATEEEIEAEINKILKNYASIEQTKNQIDIERLREYTKGVIKNEKVFKILESM